MFNNRNLSFMEHGCEDVSWNDIVLALENSKETTLADVIKTQFNIKISGNDFISCAKEAHDRIQMFSNKEVYLLSEETVVEKLKQLHRSFTSLERDIRCKLDELVKSGKASLHDIAA